MALKQIFLIAFLCGQGSIVGASAKNCHSLYKLRSDSNKDHKISVELKGAFTSQHKALVQETVEEALELLSPALQEPINVKIHLDKDTRSEGGEAFLHLDLIALSESALKLNPTLFKALLAHELTHLVVVRNFKSGSSESVRDAIIRLDDPLASLSHDPYSELLADTLPVLLNRDPKTFPKLIREIMSHYLKTDQDQTDASAPLPSRDNPIELSIRDFSLSHEDPRWASYRPSDMTYNRFNQIRSYLWQRWITRLPKSANSRFYLLLQSSLAEIHLHGALDRITYSEPDRLFKANKLLIDHLEKVFSEAFPGI